MELSGSLDAAVRGIASAAKTLRLYPPTSPIPMQAVGSAIASLSDFFELQPVLALTLSRDGFTFAGEPVAVSTPGVSDLAEQLRSHGIAEVDLTSDCCPEDLLRFLSALDKEPETVRGAGGLGAVLASEGVESVRAVEVALTVVDGEILRGDEPEVDEFLKDLVRDPGKLGVWLGAASKADPGTFREGLEELLTVSGGDMRGLVSSLSPAFQSLDSDGKDSFLGLAMDPGSVRELAEGVFGSLSSGEIAGSLVEGLYGNNMLSLSSALTGLPLSEKADDVLSRVKELLPATGHTEKELEFLGHMVEVRQRTESERPLIAADSSYQAVADALWVDRDQVSQGLAEVGTAMRKTDEKSVTTMLTLLDQQRDLELYCRSLDALAAMVPKLLERSEVGLASRIVSELASREARISQPWPELNVRLRDAITKATDQRAMHALLAAISADSSLLPAARELLRWSGEASPRALVEDAMDRRTMGDLELAESLLGRRVLDILQSLALKAQWFQVAPIVARLAREGDQRSTQAVVALLKRGDEQSRREAVQGIASAGGESSVRLLAPLLSDPSAEVAVIAVRALSRSSSGSAAGPLIERLREIDVDGKDFLLGRELIGALARVDDRASGEALKKLANRKALIKRGRFAEVTELARQALDVRAKRQGH